MRQTKSLEDILKACVRDSDDQPSGAACVQLIEDLTAHVLELRRRQGEQSSRLRHAMMGANDFREFVNLYLEDE